MKLLSSFTAGLIFGLGLIMAGMTEPTKVLGFLDILGPWDPSLLLVMCAALVVATISFYLAKKNPHALLGDPIHLPGTRHIDLRLISGSLLFGIGWGLSGYCPGPALVSLSAGSPDALIFSIAMLTGMLMYEIAHLIQKESS